MRFLCHKCGHVVGVVSGVWHKIRRPVMVCWECYEELSSAYEELNIKESDYSGGYSGGNDIDGGHALGSLKEMFGFK